MSVLDRAIVKAFERRSQSAATEKPVAAAALPVAPAVRSDPAQPESAEAHALQKSVVRDVASVEIIEANRASNDPLTPPSDLNVRSQPDGEPSLDMDTSVASPPTVPRGTVDTPVDSRVDASIEESMFSAESPTEALETSIFSTAESVVVTPTRLADPKMVSVQDSHSIIQDSSAYHELTSAELEVASPVLGDVAESVHALPVSPPIEDLSQSAVWQWPEICEQLDQYTGDGFRQLAGHLQYSAEHGLQVLAFTSSQRDAGRTSVLLTLTRILAAEGRSRVLLIDADHRHPHIAALVNLNPELGLEHVLQDTNRCHECTISLTPGQVSLLPLTMTFADGIWKQLTPVLRPLLQKLKREYDLILIDAGVFGPETRPSDCWLRGIADAVVTVARQLPAGTSEHRLLDWKQLGIESLGVIETFA